MRSMASRLAFLIFALFTIDNGAASASPFRVLVVMSYEEPNPWCQEIKKGIESALGGHADISYFYMDTKKDPENGRQKAAEAFALYETLRPHGVIAADDNAQSMFVVPFLKNKTDTPVMFCGVNKDASAYGYPASNVSGILERGHVRETLAFIQQLKPEIKTVSFMVKHSPSGLALESQVTKEKAGYPAAIEGFYSVRTLKEVTAVGQALRSKTDAIFVDSLEGITDPQGQALANQEILDQLTTAFAGPIAGANRYHVAQGALTAVVKTGEEQGLVAAEMLLRALNGEPVANLAVTRNYRGRRIINVTTLRALGLKPRPMDLRGAKLVRTVR